MDTFEYQGKNHNTNPNLTANQVHFLLHTLQNPHDGGECHAIVKATALRVLTGEQEWADGLYFIENGAYGYEIKTKIEPNPNFQSLRDSEGNPKSYIELSGGKPGEYAPPEPYSRIVEDQEF